MYIERTHRATHFALRTHTASEPPRRPARVSRNVSPSPSLPPRDHPRYFRIADRPLFTRPRANAATFPSRSANARASRASRAARLVPAPRLVPVPRPVADVFLIPLVPFVAVAVVVAFFDLRDASRGGRAGGAGGLAAANDATIINFDRASPSWTYGTVGGGRDFPGDAALDAEPPAVAPPTAPRAANAASTAARAAASISSRVNPGPELDARAPPGLPASASA